MQHLLVNSKYKELWGKSYTKKLRCLAQGFPGVSKGTDTIVFIQREGILNKCKRNVIYAQVCMNICPEKDNPDCTRVTVGGNLVHYPGDSSAPTVDMVTVKLTSQLRHLSKERTLLHH
jgi:hypothetical protein